MGRPAGGVRWWVLATISMKMPDCKDENSSVAGHVEHTWKVRGGACGLHLYSRSTGTNILIEEIAVPERLYSRGPRHISIALTNRCDLSCAHCYAPKSHGELRPERVVQWLAELDVNGTLGVGFGGGEPTLYPEFARLCQRVARETRLSVSFTTHGHHIDEGLANDLRGSVNFVRVSMDGVGDTYASIRRRPFAMLLARLKNIQMISPFGINIVINERTMRDLDESAMVAEDSGACELLLLPQMPVRRVPSIQADTMKELLRWVDSYAGNLKICINEASAEGFPVCDPLTAERGIRAYAHIDASGVLKASSYDTAGVQIGDGGVLLAIDHLTKDSIGRFA